MHILVVDDEPVTLRLMEKKLARRHPGVSEEDFRIVEAVGLLHDIGMAGFPERIFSNMPHEDCVTRCPYDKANPMPKRGPKG